MKGIVGLSVSGYTSAPPLLAGANIRDRGRTATHAIEGLKRGDNE